MTDITAAMITGKETVELLRFAHEVPRAGCVTVDITLCGICGTDKHTFNGETVQYAGTPAESHTPFPMIPGHEIVGRVADIGKSSPPVGPPRSPGTVRSLS